MSHHIINLRSFKKYAASFLSSLAFYDPHKVIPKNCISKEHTNNRTLPCAVHRRVGSHLASRLSITRKTTSLSFIKLSSFSTVSFTLPSSTMSSFHCAGFEVAHQQLRTESRMQEIRNFHKRFSNCSYPHRYHSNPLPVSFLYVDIIVHWNGNCKFNDGD